MRPIQFVGVFVFACALLIARPSRADDGPLARRFLERYAPAADKLRTFYSNLRLSARRTNREFVWRKWDYVEDVHFWAGGESFRVERLAKTPYSETSKAGITLGRVADPRLSFFVQRDPSKPDFYFSRVELPHREVLEAIRLSFPLPFAPYCFLDWTIVDLINDPGFTVKEILDIDQGGTSLVKLLCDQQLRAAPESDQTVTRSGWFLFAPDDSWALREYDLGGPLTRMRALVEYRGTQDGIPLVKKVTLWYERGAERKHDGIETLEAIKLTPGPQPAKEFTPSAFGLPDLSPPVPETRRLPYWLFAAAIAALLLGVALKYYARRRRHV